MRNIQLVSFFVLVNLNFGLGLKGCLDAAGLEVDWFIIYKPPRSCKGDLGFCVEGKRYGYIKSNQQEWAKGVGGIHDSTSPLYHTIKQNSAGTQIFSFNDQQDGGVTSSKFAHTKGYIQYSIGPGTQDVEGFWLMHSVPNWLPKSTEQNIGYPTNGYRNGQMFLCMSLKGLRDNFENDLRMYFRDNNPACSDKEQCSLPKKYVNTTQARQYSMLSLSDRVKLPGTPTMWIRDNDEGNAADVFGEIFANKYGITDINKFAQTWRPSTPNAENISKNIKNLKLPFDKEITWTGGWYDENSRTGKGSDHSKWGIAKGITDQKNVVCIGDLNKCKSKRRGGTVCFQDNAIYDRMQELIGITSIGDPDDESPDENADKCSSTF